jgi:hypothetical protein
MSAESLTAFPATERAYREAVTGRGVDRRSFDRPLSRCDLANCRGSCCATGVALNDESAAVIRRVVAAEREFFARIGCHLPDDPVTTRVDDEGVPFSRTTLVPRQFHGRVEGFAEHFPDASCCFLLGDGRCSLQVLSVSRGRHPWYYKPFPCWLHPIVVSEAGVTVPDEETDVLRDIGDGGFTTATLCGRTDRGGRPAAELLGDELEFLSAVTGRDLRAELSGDAAG